MEDLERQLKKALERQEAPAWFEAKVMAAIARQADEKPSWWRRTIGMRTRWATAAAVVAMVTSGVVWQHEHTVAVERERAAGEAAKARLELALRITSIKLHKIREKVNELNQTDKKTRSL